MKELRGLKIVITGKLSDGWLRKEAKIFIEDLGGTLQNSVTYSTDYVVTGEKPGKTKLRAANLKWVRIITEEQLFDLIDRQGEYK